MNVNRIQLSDFGFSDVRIRVMNFKMVVFLYWKGEKGNFPYLMIVLDTNLHLFVH